MSPHAFTRSELSNPLGLAVAGLLLVTAVRSQTSVCNSGSVADKTGSSPEKSVDSTSKYPSMMDFSTSIKGASHG